MSAESEKISSPGLFILVVILFFASIAFIGFEVVRKINSPTKTEQNNSETAETQKGAGNNSDLSKYFSNPPDADVGTDDYYLQNDPFRNTCSPSGGGKTPFIISGTVCYR